MIAKVIVPEAGELVELMQLYQCAAVLKSHCLSFRNHTAVPNCVSRLSRALVTCYFYKMVCVVTLWMAAVRLCNSTDWLVC